MKIENLDEWRAADRQLLAAGAHFTGLSVGQDEILKEQQRHLRNSGRDTNPIVTSVFAARELRRLQGEWNDVLGKMRQVRQRIWSVAEGAFENREALGRLLADRHAELEKLAEGSALRGRGRFEYRSTIPHWRESMDYRRQNGWIPHFIVAYYGDEMGPLLARGTVNRRGGRRGTRGRGARRPPDPTDDFSLEEKLAVLQESIDEHERNIEISRQWIERRSRSIEGLLAEMKKLEEEAKAQQTGKPTPTPTPPPRETAFAMERAAWRWSAAPWGNRVLGEPRIRHARFAGRFDIYFIPPA